MIVRGSERVSIEWYNDGQGIALENHETGSVFMNLLVFNCGSSSQGFTVFHQNENGEPSVTAHGKAHNVATKTKAAALLEWTIDGGKGSATGDFSTHRLAAEAILAVLKEHHVAIDAVGHRFVNGGGSFKRAAKLDDEALEKLRACLPLAPIHNPNSYSVIEVCREQLPDVPQYAVFDTSFHSGMPKENTVYAIPQDFAERHAFRKIGFHGLSYQYVAGRAAALLGKKPEELKLVMCHLGTGGSSVCAYMNGRSVDTSMGYSPLSGLVMSTRSGDIDPEIVLEMIRDGMSADEVSAFLNKKSGLLGLSGYSSNPGEIIEAAKQGNANCDLAFKAYCGRLRRYIGAFLYEMNGADALIFTDDGGVNYPELREAVCANADFIGMKLNLNKNYAYNKRSEARISADDSRIQVWVIPTDEERTICNEIINYENQ